MSYKINKTDGQLLVDLIDGRIDTDTIDLALVGRNYVGYGEQFNENFVKLLENFANTAPPPKPMIGQLWYDLSEGRLKIWTGTEFKSSDTTIVSSIQPELAIGNIWIDPSRQQMYFSDGGTTPVLAGPIYTRAQQETGFRVETLTDVFGNAKTVAKLMVGGTAIAIISKENFTLSVPQTGFPLAIKNGFNITTNPEFSNFEFGGIASLARQLLDENSEVVSPANFLRNNTNNTTSGNLHIKNDTGLTVGFNTDFTVRVEAGTVINRLQNNNANYRLQVRLDNNNVDAIRINTTDQYMGIWNTNPQYSMDVNGNLRATGSVFVGASPRELATIEYVDNASFTRSLTVRGDWDSNADYDINDIVYFNGSSYIAIDPNQNSIPDVSPLFWQLLSLQGFTGSKGDTGFTGSRGFTGSFGFTGSQGASGFVGSQGFNGSRGFTGSAGFTGSKGDTGTSIRILGEYVTELDLPGYPSSYGGLVGDTYVVNGELYVWTGSAWINTGPFVGPTGFTGSLGFTGSVGFTGSRGNTGFVGSQGATGFVGSQGAQGFTGSIGFTGSQGDTGFVGSRGDTGFVGSQGDIGFTGSQGPIGFTGSQGEIGFTGSLGFTGSQGFTGQPGSPNAISIPYPIAGDTFVLMWTSKEIELSQIQSLVIGASTPTVSVSLLYGSSYGTGTSIATFTVNNTTVGNSVTVFDNSIIPANSFVWIVVNSTSGTVDQLHSSLIYESIS